MNKYAPHLYVIPEDDATRQLADGFVLHHHVKESRIQVVPPAGGWLEVLKTFKEEYLPKLQQYPHAHVVMLIDFDGFYAQRRPEFENDVPNQIRPRVFVVGSKRNPETLKKELKKSFEEIGRALANDCDAGTTALWGHDQLNHNDPDRIRLVQAVK